MLRAVGVDRDQHAAAVHDRRVVGNRVLGLDLVGPPVGERRAARAVLRHFVSHLVALEHVLEGGNLEAHLFSEPDEHQRFVGAIGVGVHQALAFEDLDQRLELQIASRHRRVLARFLAAFVVQPLFLVDLGAAERIADHELGAGARNRIAARSGLPELPHVFRILAERELDARRSAFEDQPARVLAPAQFDHLVLAADRVGAAVQHVRHRQAAGEVAIDCDVGRVEDVLDPRHRAHRRAALVDRFRGNVRVRVDDAGRDESPGGVDNLRARRYRRAGSADRGDPAVADDHHAVLDGAARDGQNGAATNRDDTSVLRERPRLQTGDKPEAEQNGDS